MMLLRAFPIFLLAAAMTPALAQADGMTPVSLRVSAPANTVRYDFGDTRLLDEPQLVHTFRLRNDGLAPLTLASLVPSCHCTTATVEPDGALPTLAPGQQVSVRVSVEAEPYLTGPLLKSVAVYAQGITDPVATLEMAATLRPSVTWTPTDLNFGAVPAGHARSATVTAALDPRLLDGNHAPRLQASDPDIRIIPIAAHGQSSAFRTFTYRVTLTADAALGPVHDLLRFAPAPPGTETAHSLADGPAVSVNGRLVGAATVSPSAAVFGAVRQGHVSTLALRLDTRAPTFWHSARAAADRPWVTARLLPARRTLAVTLTDAAPPGSVQAQLTVTLANGQRLRVPVTAYVTTSRLP